MAQADPPGCTLLLSSIFSATTLDFRNRVPDCFADTFAEIRTLEDLECAIRDIEAGQAQRKSFRYFNKIKPCLKALDEYSKVIEVFVNAKPDIMAFVWGPIKICLLVASKFDRAFDSLLSAYVKIKDALPHFSAVELLFKSNPQVQNVLGNVYKDILAFHLRALTFFSRPGWKIALRMTCRAFEDLFDDIFSNLEQSKALLYSSASIAHYQEAQVARHQIEAIIKTQQETARLQKRTFVHAWLNPTEHQTRHEELCAIREQYPQTAKWIFNELSYKNWLNNEETNGRVLWVKGTPGAGKTVIFSSMVDELTSRSGSGCNKAIAVAHVYCKYNDQRRNKPTELIRSIIHQLIGSNDICAGYLYDTAENSLDSTARNKKVLMTALEDILQCFNEVFLGIDGLDECEQKERGEMITLLKELLKLPVTSCILRVFVTSQAELDIQRFMASMRYRVEIESEHLSKDILSYTEKRSAELVRFDLTRQQARDVAKAVFSRSTGMFLLARLIFDLFERCTTRSDFDDEFATTGLPSGIDEAYARILSRVRKRECEAGRQRARSVLEILSCAKRRLYVHELQGMLSMDVTNHRIDFSRRRYTQHFKEICGPLVELHVDGTIDLAHQTVKGYLDQYHSDYVSLPTAAINVTKICTSYLSLDIFNSACQGENLDSDIAAIQINLFSFSECAHQDEDDLPSPTCTDVGSLLEATYRSLEHNRHDEDSPVVRQLSRIQRFIEAAVSSPLSSEKEHFLKEAYGPRPFSCPNTSCSRFHDGFPTSAERDSHLNTHERQFLCPFEGCQAHTLGFSTKRALNTHVDMFHVTTLVPQFSELKPTSIWVALQESIETDDEALVEDLSVEAMGYPEKPPDLVFQAIIKGRFNSARVLLRHFYDPEDICSDKSSKRKFLEALAESGDPDLTRSLFLHYPELVDISHYVTSVLTKSLGKVRIDMAILFLQQMRLQNSKWVSDIRYSERALSIFIGMVARNGSEDDLSTILDLFGKSSNRSSLGQVCMSLAAKGRMRALKQVLSFFLTAFAVQLQSMQRFKDLQHLSIEDAMTRLTDEVVSNSKNGGSFGSAFQQAAARGDVDALSRLWDLGVDIDSVSGQQGTALQAASKKGQVDVVHWLLERGAQVEVVGGEYGNAIAAAAATGKVEVLQVLLEVCQTASQEARAIIRKRGRQPTLALVANPTTATPLHFAAAEMQEETIQVLLEWGADVAAIDTNGNTALHTCLLGPYIQAPNYRRVRLTNWLSKSVASRIRRSSCVVANLLLKKGADIRAQNNDGSCPLHLLFTGKSKISKYDRDFTEWTVLAHKELHPCTVQMSRLLFDAGASFDQPDGNGISAKQAAIEIGGQLLEDLKQEIPIDWESFEDCKMPNILSPGSPTQQERSSWSGEETTSSRNEYSPESMAAQVPDLPPIFANPDQITDASYTTPDAMEWIPANSEALPGYLNSLSNDAFVAFGNTMETDNEFIQSGGEDIRSSDYLSHPSSELFMNPWSEPWAQE